MKYKLLQKVRYLSKQGQAMMTRRREDVEPTFGNIKRNFNFRSFYLRGKPKCLVELGLVSMALNIQKIKTHLSKTQNFNLSASRLGHLPR